MHESYRDITSRIAEEPQWYDQDGVPRYDSFTPRMCPNIYANTVILMRIRCQACHRSFLVEIHGDMFDDLNNRDARQWHYGDPPFHDCPRGGDTMNCEDDAVLQCWHRSISASLDWERFPAFEGAVD